MEKLKIGDKIYIRKYSLIGYETVIKTTKTIARTKNYNFEIDIKENGYCRVKGKGVWDNTCGYIETEQLKKEWEELKMVNWFDDKRFSKEEKIKIYKLFNK